MAGVDVYVHSKFGPGDKPFATVITGELAGHIVAFQVVFCTQIKILR